jgi:N-acyl-D-aspartate/D-glutamate deacylase
MVFDPATIATSSTFGSPAARPDGIREVFVNGRAAVSGGELTGAFAGRVLS